MVYKNNENLTYWSLLLQDFNIEWVVTPGSQMGPTDALFHKDDVDTSSDNHFSSIIPNPVIINMLDLTLSKSIASSTLSDLLIVCVLPTL